MRFLVLLLFLVPVVAQAETRTFDVSPIRKWMSTQKNLHSVSADFVQTRALATLRSPIAVPGKIWFAEPGSFRWEMGDPAKLVVVSGGEGVTVVHPLKQKAERISPDAINKQAGMQGMGMMKFPFTGGMKEFLDQFDLLDISTEGDRCHLQVLPKNAQARKFLSSITFDFDTATGALYMLEFTTREGSSMRNEFSNIQLNKKIDPAVFRYDLTGFKVTDEVD